MSDIFVRPWLLFNVVVLVHIVCREDLVHVFFTPLLRSSLGAHKSTLLARARGNVSALWRIHGHGRIGRNPLEPTTYVGLVGQCVRVLTPVGRPTEE